MSRPESYIPQPDLIDHDHDEWLSANVREGQKARLSSHIGQEALQNLIKDNDNHHARAHAEFVARGNAEQAERDAKIAKIDALATQFHENWRKTRLNEQGEYEPRIKETKDKAWIKSHGKNQVDIANSSYEDLPQDWRAENEAAAAVVVELIERQEYLFGKVDLSKPETRLSVGSEVHEAWLGRNDWATGGELDVPFEELPANEQAKDIEQVEIGLQVLDPKE